MTTTVDSSERSGSRAAARPLLVVALLAGAGIGPAVAAGAAVGGAAPPVLAAVLMIGLAAFGAAGLAVSLVRWSTAGRRGGPVGGAAPVAVLTAFSGIGQRASLVLAVIELLILAIAAPLVLLLHLTGPQGGPTQDVTALLVAAIALVAISALIVPTIAAQIAWTWRPEAALAEAAVLSGAVPGPGRLIRAARAVAVVAWTLCTLGAIVTAVLLTREAAQRLMAIAHSYSPYSAAESVRGDLLDEYVVGDVHCPTALPDPGSSSTFTCRVTSLGRTLQVRANWSPSGFGTGDVSAADPDHAGLTRIADLPVPAPAAVSLDEDASAAEVVAAVRHQLLAEGWSRSSRAVRDLRCPGVDRDQGTDAAAVQCTIGTDPRTQRYLDVYPTAQRRFTARTAEISDLPH